MDTLRVLLITPSVAATPGLPRDADALPVGTLWRNGTALAVSVTVTDKGVGRYLVSVPLDPADGFVDGDSAALEVTWTMEGTVGISQVVAQGLVRADVVTRVFTLDLSTVTGEARRSLLNMVRRFLNKVTRVGTVGTVYKEDDTTIAYTVTLGELPGAVPVVNADPD